MVRRKGARRKPTRACRPVGGSKISKAAYKKCLISTIKRTKISTPKSARKAFAAAAKRCRVHLTGAPVRRTTRRRAGAKRRTTRRTSTAGRSTTSWSPGSWSGNIPRRADRAMRSKFLLDQ